MEKITVGVLTVSDRCKNKEATDESGPNLSRMIEDGVVRNGVVTKVALVPDNAEDIKKVLVKWCEEKVDLILTTGGTGLGERDVTPEVTLEVMDKVVPGINHLMLRRSLEVTALAALSRAVAGVKGSSLIVNLPGSKKASQECLEAVADVIPHAVDLIKGQTMQVNQTHESLIGGKSSLVLKGAASRSRTSPYPLITVEQAEKVILKRVCILRKEKTVRYQEALGHVLAQEVIAGDNLPPFDVSLRDGYAITQRDARTNIVNSQLKVLKAGSSPLDVSLRDGYAITQRDARTNIVNSQLKVLKAGSSPLDVKLLPDHCVRVSTGMAIPSDADAVIQVEDTKLVSANANSEEEKIALLRTVRSGTNIRNKGSDFVSGQLLLRYGAYLDPPSVGLLAASANLSVRVMQKPAVAVISTGDELATLEDPRPGKILDSNRVFLLGLLKEEGFAGLDLGIAPDDPDALRSSLERGFRAADVVVTSGSMSMGERDFLKDVLVADFGAEIHFGRVCMKPGKPTSFGTLNFGGKPKVWFGLPGNPASTFVTSHLFLLPALRKIAGWEKVKPMTVLAETKNAVEPELDRVHYARAILSYCSKSETWIAEVMEDQASSNIGNCVNANCLLQVPRGDGFQGGKVFPSDSKMTALLIGKIAFRT